MEPGVGRSIQQGFAAAAKSWAGIGMFAIGWIVLAAVAIGGVLLSRPPAALTTEPGTRQSSSAGGRGSPAAEGGGAALTPSSETSTTPSAGAPATPTDTTAPASDLFNQLSSAKDVPAAAPPVVDPESVPLPARAQDDTAKRDRQIGEWFGHAWPLLLVTFLLVAAGNLWLTGGRIGYVAKRVTSGQTSVSEFIASGGRAFLPLLGGTGLSLAAAAVLMLAGVLLAVALSALGGSAPAWLGIILGIIGVVLLIAIFVSLIWLMVRLSFWFVAIVADRLGPMAALRRSFRVTRGRWWQILGLALVASAISFSVWLPLGLLEWLGGLMGGTGAAIVGVVVNLAGLIAGLFLGFAMLGAYVRFYEDAKAGRV